MDTEEAKRCQAEINGVLAKYKAQLVPQIGMMITDADKVIMTKKQGEVEEAIVKENPTA